MPVGACALSSFATTHTLKPTAMGQHSLTSRYLMSWSTNSEPFKEARISIHIPPQNYAMNQIRCDIIIPPSAKKPFCFRYPGKNFLFISRFHVSVTLTVISSPLFVHLKWRKNLCSSWFWNLLHHPVLLQSCSATPSMCHCPKLRGRLRHPRFAKTRQLFSTMFAELSSWRFMSSGTWLYVAGIRVPDVSKAPQTMCT